MKSTPITAPTSIFAEDKPSEDFAPDQFRKFRDSKKRQKSPSMQLDPKNTSPRYLQKPPIGAVRLIDGVYLGDQFACKDANFLQLNKITHIINAAGHDIENNDRLIINKKGQKMSLGLKFLSMYWVDNDCQLIFDEEDRVPVEIVKFIDEAINSGTSALIHSMRGQSRASVIGILYFMEKYQWGLLKALEFINSRRPDLEIRANFLQQIQKYTKRKKSISNQVLARTHEWDENISNLYKNQKTIQTLLDSERVIQNTYLNSQHDEKQQIPIKINQNEKNSIQWPEKINELQVKNDLIEKIKNKKRIEKITTHYKSSKNSPHQTIEHSYSTPYEQQSILRTSELRKPQYKQSQEAISYIIQKCQLKVKPQELKEHSSRNQKINDTKVATTKSRPLETIQPTRDTSRGNISLEKSKEKSPMKLSTIRKMPHSLQSSPKQSPRIGVKISPKNHRIATADSLPRKVDSERKDFLTLLENDIQLTQSQSQSKILIPKLNIDQILRKSEAISRLSSDAMAKKKHVKSLTFTQSNFQMYSGTKTIPSKQIKIVRQQTARDPGKASVRLISARQVDQKDPQKFVGSEIFRPPSQTKFVKKQQSFTPRLSQDSDTLQNYPPIQNKDKIARVIQQRKESLKGKIYHKKHSSMPQNEMPQINI